jgi:hypothetical protein
MLSVIIFLHIIISFCFSGSMWQWFIHYRTLCLKLSTVCGISALHSVSGCGPTLNFRWLDVMTLTFFVWLVTTVGFKPRTTRPAGLVVSILTWHQKDLILTTVTKNIKISVSIMMTNLLKIAVQPIPEMSYISNIPQTMDNVQQFNASPPWCPFPALKQHLGCQNQMITWKPQ